MGPNYSEDLNQKIDRAIKDSSGDQWGFRSHRATRGSPIAGSLISINISWKIPISNG